MADVPTEFATATGIFAPVNYNRHCYGPMRYRVALANSLNISAVKVLASIGGPEPLQRLLQQCGLSTLGQPAETYGLGLTIGNAEVRLLELANAYACLGSDNTNRIACWWMARILRASRPLRWGCLAETTVLERAPTPRRGVPTRACWNRGRSPTRPPLISSPTS